MESGLILAFFEYAPFGKPGILRGFQGLYSAIARGVLMVLGVVGEPVYQNAHPATTFFPGPEHDLIGSGKILHSIVIFANASRS